MLHNILKSVFFVFYSFNKSVKTRFDAEAIMAAFYTSIFIGSVLLLIGLGFLKIFEGNEEDIGNYVGVILLVFIATLIYFLILFFNKKEDDIIKNIQLEVDLKSSSSLMWGFLIFSMIFYTVA